MVWHQEHFKPAQKVPTTTWGYFLRVSTVFRCTNDALKIRHTVKLPLHPTAQPTSSTDGPSFTQFVAAAVGHKSNLVAAVDLSLDNQNCFRTHPSSVMFFPPSQSG